MAPVHLQSLAGWAVATAACVLFAACSTHVSPGSVRDLERQAQAATERHRIKTAQATASLAQQPDGREVVVIGYPASAAPAPPQVAAISPTTAYAPAKTPTPMPTPVPQGAQAVASAAPAATTSTVAGASAAPAISPEQSVRDTLEAWRSAWARGDADAYFRFYGPVFKGQNSSRADWEKQRRTRLGNTGIRVQFDNIRIRTVSDRAEVNLVQRYTSTRHSDTGDKQLRLRRVDGAWRIFGEDWAPVKVAPGKAAK